MNQFEFALRKIGRWKLFMLQNRADITCSRCGNVEMVINTAFPMYDEIIKKAVPMVKEENKYCRKCGTRMCEDAEI